jgi:hypothetical protein
MKSSQTLVKSIELQANLLLMVSTEEGLKWLTSSAEMNSLEAQLAVRTLA